MARITLDPAIGEFAISNNRKPNGNPKSITSRKDYYIKYRDVKHNVHNSILAELRKHGNGTYTLVSKSFAVKTKAKVSMQDRKRATLLFGAMKLLDALDTNYFPESVRLVKA